MSNISTFVSRSGNSQGLAAIKRKGKPALNILLAAKAVTANPPPVYMNEECKYDCSVGESGDLVSRLRNPSTTMIVPAMAACPQSNILVERRAARKRKDETPTPATAYRIHASLPVGRATIACESVTMPRLNEATRGVNPFDAGNGNSRL